MDLPVLYSAIFVVCFLLIIISTVSEDDQMLNMGLIGIAVSAVSIPFVIFCTPEGQAYRATLDEPVDNSYGDTVSRRTSEITNDENV